jgi:hypothetical protein
MLYNRFSSLAIRILPLCGNVLYRVSLARRYIDFVKAAAATRSVCIRAANFFRIAGVRHGTPYQPCSQMDVLDGTDLDSGVPGPQLLTAQFLRLRLKTRANAERSRRVWPI